jgi:hypothetical protein
MINRLAEVFAATRAAPTSPRVLGTDDPIDAPFLAAMCCSSALCDSVAILLDRPVTTIKFFDCNPSPCTSSMIVCSGLDDDATLNWILESAEAVLASWEPDGEA